MRHARARKPVHPQESRHYFILLFFKFCAPGLRFKPFKEINIWKIYMFLRLSNICLMVLEEMELTYVIWLFGEHHHHHIRHNNPGRVTASLIIRLQTSLSLATVHQFWIFNFFTSSWTATLHLEQGLPTPLLPSGLPSIILLTNHHSSFFEHGLPISV